MSRLVPRTICVLWLVLFATVIGAAAPATGQQTRTIAGTQLAPDDVALRIDIREDGTAEWEVEYRVLLDDENSTAAFESVRQDVEADGSEYSSEFRGRMESTAATAENATGREMAIKNVSVSASRQQLPREYGVLTYRFVWVNFAVVDGDSLRVGDALRGLFLDEETSLLVTWPEGYVVEDAAPAPDDRRTRTVVWNGPLDFGPGEPSLVVAPEGTAGSDAGVTTNGPTTADDGSSPEGGDGPNLWLGGAGLLVAAAVVGGGWALYRRRESGVPADAGTVAPTDWSGGTDASEATASDGASGTDRTDAPETDGPAATAIDADAAGSTPSDPDDGSAAAAEAGDGTPPWEDELLSNEERVLALMEHEGGRLKQQEVAQTLDWTDAKTSQVVRRMREADELDAFRLGRENVLVLPDADADRGGE